MIPGWEDFSLVDLTVLTPAESWHDFLPFLNSRLRGRWVGLALLWSFRCACDLGEISRRPGVGDQVIRVCFGAQAPILTRQVWYCADVDDAANNRQEEGRQRAALTKRARTREAIEAAALSLGDAAMEDLTVRQLAKISAISIPTFYKHFPSISFLSAEMIRSEIHKDWARLNVDVSPPRDSSSRLMLASCAASVIQRLPSLAVKAGTKELMTCLFDVLFEDSPVFWPVYADYVDDAMWHACAATGMILISLESSMPTTSAAPNGSSNRGIKRALERYNNVLEGYVNELEGKPQ